MAGVVLAWMAALSGLTTSAHAQRTPTPKAADEKAVRRFDLIDRHAASASRELTRTLEQVDKLAAEQQWPAVIERLQFLIDLPEDALIQEKNGWVSLKRVAEERLRRLPDDARRAYLNQYGKTAEEALAAAQSRNDFHALCRVASRFRQTPAGQKALDEAAGLLADSGDFVTAAAWSSELQKENAPITATLAWRRRAAAVWKRLGQNEKAAQLRNAAETTPDFTAGLIESTEEGVSGDRWTGLYGGHQRLNRARGDRPLILEEWSAPATENESLQDEIQQLQIGLVDGAHVLMPVATPIAMDHLIAIKTLGGIEVRDVTDGKVQWRTRARASVEALLTPEIGERFAAVALASDLSDPDTHPLTSLLYRDATIGQLTTDGRRLFAISRQVALLSETDHGSVTNAAIGADILRGDRSVNSIVAFDFRTGQSLWSVGGSKNDEPFASPLAGVYFFGPPTADGDELFAIGANGDEINLYCLDAATGQPQWKQFIAQYDTAKIADDVVRQMWSCSPTVVQGMIYCPTNAGWLVAVDRYRRRLAWASRYAEGEVSDHYQPQYSLLGLDERWSQSAPIVADGIVVFAPPELPDEPAQTDPRLYQFDAVSGQILTSQHKVEGVAVAGIVGDAILIVGREKLTAWPLMRQPGTSWSVRYPQGLTPCGLGVTVNGIYWAPFLEGAIVGFHAKTGAIEAVLRNDALTGRLGNLLFHRDRVVSAGAAGIVGLWQKSALDTFIAERLAQNPRDLEARLKTARAHFAASRFEQALSELEAAESPPDSSSPFAAAARELKWTCLCKLLAPPTAGHEARWQELSALATTPDRQETVLRMTVDRAIAGGHWSEALAVCWPRIDAPTTDQIQDGGVFLTQDAWIAGRLEDIWNKAPHDVRDDLSARIATRAAIAPGNLAIEAPRLERLFAFHPQGRRLTLLLGLADAALNELALAEIRLSQLTAAPDPEISAAAAKQLVELYAHNDCRADAARTAKFVEKLPADTRLPDGSTVGRWLDVWKRTAMPIAVPLSRWNLADARVVRMGLDDAHLAGDTVPLQGSPADWMTGQRFETSGRWDGLAWIDSATGERRWTTPLPSAAHYESEATPNAVVRGSVLAVCYRGLLHVYSPRDRRELWSWALPPRFINPPTYGWAEEHLVLQAAGTASDKLDQFQSNLDNAREGVLMTIVGQRLVLLGQRQLIVFDLLTGEEQWRRDGIAPAALLIANDHAVCVSAMHEGGQPAAFRLVDGRPMEPGKLPAALKRAFSVEGDVLLTRQSLLSLFTPRIRLAAERPLTGETVWSHVLPRETVLHHLRGRELAGIQPDGEVFVIDLPTGELIRLGRLSAELMEEEPVFHLLADDDRIYVAVQKTQTYDLSHFSIPSIMLSGEFVAFDRQQRRLLWRERMREGSVLTADFSSSPVVIIGEHGTPERRRDAVDGLLLPELKLTVIDKVTGARVIQWTGVTSQGGSPSSMTVDAHNHRIDIDSYNERFRIQFGPQPGKPSQ